MVEEPYSVIVNTAKGHLMPVEYCEFDQLEEVNKDLKRAIFYLMVRLWLLESEE